MVHRDSPPIHGQTCSRRGALSLVAATAACGLGSAAVSAQDTETADAPPDEERRVVAPNGDDYEGDLVSKELLVAERIDDEPDRDAIANCDFAGWPPEETDVYRVSVVESVSRTGDEQREQSMLIYASADDPPFEIGSEYMIAERSSCPDGAVGLRISRIPPESRGTEGEGVADDTEEPDWIGMSGEPDEGGEDGDAGTEEETESSADTPGFGVVAAVSAVLGGAAAHLRGRR